MNIRYKERSPIDGLIGQSSAGGNDLNKADIVIYGRTYYNDLNPTQDIFASTIHELAHWSHRLFYDRENHKGDYEDMVNKFISESWASCIEWYITTNYYSGLFGELGYRNGFQSWNNQFQEPEILYTPIFIDLFDTYNQSLTNSSTHNDNISSYTLPEIQNNIIKHSYNCSTLKYALTNHKLHGATDTDINNIIEQYEEINGF